MIRCTVSRLLEPECYTAVEPYSAVELYAALILLPVIDTAAAGYHCRR
jgi:hypothetical protein